jgi:hypothetical protein
MHPAGRCHNHNFLAVQTILPVSVRSGIGLTIFKPAVIAPDDPRAIACQEEVV